MSSFNLGLGSLWMVFRGDPKPFNTAADQVTQKMQHTARQLTDIGRRASFALTLPLAGIGSASVKAFGSFNKAMVETKAVMNLTNKEMDRLAAKARKLATETVFSSNEIAQSFVTLGRTGARAEQALNQVAITTKFAQAGMFDLTTSTRLLTDAMGSLGLKTGSVHEQTKKMTELADLLTNASLRSQGSIEEFAVALTRKAGPRMRAMNMSMEEGVAILQVFADQGLKASIGGNRLEQTLRGLTRASVTHSAMWNQMGIATVTAGGHFRKVAHIVRDLDENLNRLNPSDKMRALMELGFQARELAGLLALLGQSDKLEFFEADNQSLKSKGGLVDQVALTQMEAFENQMKVLLDIMRLAREELGEHLAPIFMFVAKSVTVVTETFRALTPNAQRLIAIVGTLAAVAGPILFLVGAFKLMSISFRLLREQGIGAAFGFKKMEAAAINAAVATDAESSALATSNTMTAAAVAEEMELQKAMVKTEAARQAVTAAMLTENAMLEKQIHLMDVAEGKYGKIFAPPTGRGKKPNILSDEAVSSAAAIGPRGGTSRVSKAVIEDRIAQIRKLIAVQQSLWVENNKINQSYRSILHSYKQMVSQHTTTESSLKSLVDLHAQGVVTTKDYEAATQRLQAQLKEETATIKQQAAALKELKSLQISNTKLHDSIVPTNYSKPVSDAGEAARLNLIMQAQKNVTAARAEAAQVALVAGKASDSHVLALQRVQLALDAEAVALRHVSSNMAMLSRQGMELSATNDLLATSFSKVTMTEEQAAAASVKVLTGFAAARAGLNAWAGSVALAVKGMVSFSAAAAVMRAAMASLGSVLWVAGAALGKLVLVFAAFEAVMWVFDWLKNVGGALYDNASGAKAAREELEAYQQQIANAQKNQSKNVDQAIEEAEKNPEKATEILQKEMDKQQRMLERQIKKREALRDKEQEAIDKSWVTERAVWKASGGDPDKFETADSKIYGDQIKELNKSIKFTREQQEKLIEAQEKHNEAVEQFDEDTFQKIAEDMKKVTDEIELLNYQLGKEVYDPVTNGPVAGSGELQDDFAVELAKIEQEMNNLRDEANATMDPYIDELEKTRVAAELLKLELAAVQEQKKLDRQMENAQMDLDGLDGYEKAMKKVDQQVADLRQKGFGHLPEQLDAMEATMRKMAVTKILTEMEDTQEKLDREESNAQADVDGMNDYEKATMKVNQELEDMRKKGFDHLDPEFQKIEDTLNRIKELKMEKVWNDMEKGMKRAADDAWLDVEIALSGALGGETETDRDDMQIDRQIEDMREKGAFDGPGGADREKKARETLRSTAFDKRWAQGVKIVKGIEKENALMQASVNGLNDYEIALKRIGQEEEANRTAGVQSGERDRIKELSIAKELLKIEKEINDTKKGLDRQEQKSQLARLGPAFDSEIARAWLDMQNALADMREKGFGEIPGQMEEIEAQMKDILVNEQLANIHQPFDEMLLSIRKVNREMNGLNPTLEELKEKLNELFEKDLIDAGEMHREIKKAEDILFLDKVAKKDKEAADFAKQQKAERPDDKLHATLEKIERAKQLGKLTDAEAEEEQKKAEEQYLKDTKEKDKGEINFAGAFDKGSTEAVSAATKSRAAQAGREDKIAQIAQKKLEAHNKANGFLESIKTQLEQEQQVVEEVQESLI